MQGMQLGNNNNNGMGQTASKAQSQSQMQGNMANDSEMKIDQEMKTMLQA